MGHIKAVQSKQCRFLPEGIRTNGLTHVLESKSFLSNGHKFIKLKTSPLKADC